MDSIRTMKNEQQEYWNKISSSGSLTIKFAEKFINKINWNLVNPSDYSEEFCCHFQNKIIQTELKISDHTSCGDVLKWHNMSIYDDLSEEFIDKNHDKLDWFNMSRYQKLTPYIIDKYSHLLNWELASKYQDLPEYLIERYLNRVDWLSISVNQKLTKAFICDYSHLLNEEALSCNPNISKQDIIKAYYPMGYYDHDYDNFWRH